MTGIAEWLASIGLGEYARRFAENAIDLSVVRDLTEQDLKELGVLLGHRRKILRAIAELDGVAPAPAETATEPVPRDESERRHLTVMFSDLVGSTALSERLDPEDLWRVTASYQACTGEVIGRYQGMIARYMGDGVLAYFGYPRAQEDDVAQAVRAALALVDAVATLRTNVDVSLQVRIGIATGTVVVSELLIDKTRAEQAVFGETPNLAARLQALAEPGTVLICPSTRQLTGGHFDYRDLGPVALKGWAEPVLVWQVLGASGVESRFEAMHKTKLPPLFGREEEIELLLRRWRHATQEEGRVVLLTGEPGIGKSHIALALDERLQSEEHITLRYFCSEHHTNSALFPFIGQLERAAGFERGDSPTEKLPKLDALIAQSTADPEHGAVLANLLALPASDRYRLQELSPQKRKEKTLAALLAQLDGLAARQPVLMIFEDIHWIDPTSLELLGAIVEHVPQLRVLLLVTARPEFTPPWPNYSHMTTIPLARLGRHDGAALVERVTGGTTLPKEVMDEILARTDGVPMFIEELTKMVLESKLLQERDGHYVLERPLPPLAIPTTLRASLMARLDRLAPVREVAQIGAVAGREFHYELLHSVAGLPREELEEALGQLVRSELIFRRGEIPHAVYTFKHTLVRDAAYAGLLKSRRVHLHAAIANALEQQFPEIAQTQPETLARHLTEAGLIDPASDYWLKAGNLALSRSANAEAVKHLGHGIELTQSQAPSAKRVRKELEFYLALGPAMAATEGYATPETLRVFSHARDLLGDGGTPTEQMTVLWGVYLAHSMRAENIAAREVAHRCLALGAEHEHPGMLALANRFMGQTLWMMGAFVDARSHLERTLDLCAANQETITSYRRFGADDEVGALSPLSRTLLILGYPEQAAAVAGQALARARSMGLAFTTALALDGEALLGALGADLKRAAVHADEAMAHSIEHSLADYEQRARFIQGALLAQSGDPQHGIELMHSAIAAIECTNSVNRRTLYLGHSAAAHASVGQPEVGLDLVDEAIQTVDKKNERFFEAELYRLRGKILLTLGRRGEAEAGLRRALTIAQQQQARWWELRAAITLAEHWRDEGKYLEAYSLLQPVYGWFVEGFDTTSLRNAKALVDELRDLSRPQTQIGRR